MAGAHPVVGIDRLNNKLDMAQRFGATHRINSAGVGDLGAAIRGIVGRGGADKLIERTGVASLIEVAYEATQPKGRDAAEGTQGPRRRSAREGEHLHAAAPFRQNHQGLGGGHCEPARDIPRLIRLADAGKLSHAGIITHEFGLDDQRCARPDAERKSGRILLRIGGD
jgi:S-(hydroxymethyl)glutathione dehydrogenase/alcohol dehydrogenase